MLVSVDKLCLHDSLISLLSDFLPSFRPPSLSFFCPSFLPSFHFPSLPSFFSLSLPPFLFSFLPSTVSIYYPIGQKSKHNLASCSRLPRLKSACWLGLHYHLEFEALFKLIQAPFPQFQLSVLCS